MFNNLYLKSQVLLQNYQLYQYNCDYLQKTEVPLHQKLYKLINQKDGIYSYKAGANITKLSSSREY